MEETLEQKNLCRGCLSTDRRAISVFRCKTMYEELTGIAIGPSDGLSLSQWLCYECFTLLEKCIRFRNKIMKSHLMLCQYAMGNVPFEKNTASPHLSRTKILCYVIPGTQAETPKKPVNELVITPVVKPVITPVVKPVIKPSGIPLPVIPKVESIAVKAETVLPDENEITIEEWRKEDHELTSKSSIREPKHEKQTEQGVPEERFTESIVRDTDSPAISEVESVHIKDEELHLDSEDAASMDECCVEDSQNYITCKSHVSDQLDLDTKEIYSEPFNEEPQTEQDENAEEIYEDTAKVTEENDSEDDISTDEDTTADKVKSDSEDDVTIAKLRTKNPQNDSTSKSSIINPKHKKKSSRGNIISSESVYEGLKAFQCDECNEYFSDWYLYEEHWPIHAKESYQCNICMKNFREKSNYELHCGIHMKRSYKCDVCKSSFKYKSRLDVHVHSHTSEKRFQCDICKECFHAKISLRKHILGHKYTCGICNKKFSTRRVLIVHNRTHKNDNDKPFKCDICMKSFLRKHSLTAHMHKHNGVIPFKCDICMKSFLRKDSLNTHMRKHNGVIPFKCDVCNKPVQRKCDLDRHMRTHTSEKPRKPKTCKKVK